MKDERNHYNGKKVDAKRLQPADERVDYKRSDPVMEWLYWMNCATIEGLVPIPE